MVGGQVLNLKIGVQFSVPSFAEGYMGARRSFVTHLDSSGAPHHYLVTTTLDHNGPRSYIQRAHADGKPIDPEKGDIHIGRVGTSADEHHEKVLEYLRKTF